MSNSIEKSKTIPFAVLLLGTTALAFAPIFVRLCETTPSSIAFWRMALSTPLLAFAWILFPKPKPKTQLAREAATKIGIQDYLGLMLAGIFFTLDIVVWNLSLSYTSVAHATLFVNFASLFVALISWLIFRKPLGRGLILGMLIAIMGSTLLIWPHMKDTTDSSLLGDGLSLLAALFYALYFLFVQIARQKFSTLCIMTLTGMVTSFATLIFVWCLGETLLVQETASWLALIGLAIIVQILGQGFVAQALADLPVTLSSVVLLLQPVLSGLIAWKLFDESLVAIQMMGMIIVITGVAFAKITHARQL